jgi:hypothetical protein
LGYYDEIKEERFKNENDKINQREKLYDYKR